MMKMRKEDFYRILLNETINKRGFNPDFATQTNQYNVGEKKRLISLQYDKLKVPREKYGKKYELVANCQEDIIHHVFKRLFDYAVKWEKEKGLAEKVNSTPKPESKLELNLKSDFERHMEALDGGGYFAHNYPPYFKD